MPDGKTAPRGMSGDDISGKQMGGEAGGGEQPAGGEQWGAVGVFIEMILIESNVRPMVPVQSNRLKAGRLSCTVIT